MGNLTKEQIDHISQELDRQGITFEPLKSELLDHLICDVEIQVEQGQDFTSAWESVNHQIPENHLSNIQNETMILLKKKINPVRVFSILSILFLAFATLFKTLHLPGAGVLLFSFFIGSAATLLIESIRSIYLYRDLKGRWIILLTTLQVIVFIAGLVFKVLHLPGAGALLLFSIIGLSIFFPAVSIYFYLSRQRLKDYLIIRMIENNQKGLENIALVLIGFGLIYNLFSSPMGDPQNVGGVMFFIFSVVLIGMYAFTLTWSHFASREGLKPVSDLLLLIFSSIAFVGFMMPVIIGSKDYFVLRNVMAYTPAIIFCTIVAVHYLGFSGVKDRITLGILSGLLIGYPLLRMAIKLGWFDGTLEGLISDSSFVYGFAVFLLILLIVYRKEKFFKAMVMLTLASHMIPTL